MDDKKETRKERERENVATPPEEGRSCSGVLSLLSFSAQVYVLMKMVVSQKREAKQGTTNDAHEPQRKRAKVLHLPCCCPVVREFTTHFCCRLVGRDVAVRRLDATSSPLVPRKAPFVHASVVSMQAQRWWTSGAVTVKSLAVASVPLVLRKALLVPASAASMQAQRW